MNIGIGRKEWLFGKIVAASCGDVTLITVFGLPVYKRVGAINWLLGFAWVSPQ